MEPMYYLLIDAQKCGPYRVDELLDVGLEDDTLVWYAGREDWVRADKLVKLHGILEMGRNAHQERQQRRKIARQVAQLPDPLTLRKLSHTAIAVNMVAGALYVAGTALLMLAFVLFVVAAGRPPERVLATSFLVATVLGLTASGLGSVLLMVELGLLAAFVWNCSRIVQLLSPRGEKSQIQFSEADDLFRTSVIVLVLGGVLCGLVVLVLALALIVVFLVLYIVLAFSIYRLGFGLNRVINDYKLTVPWAPVTLAFWVGLCALLLLLGPLSVPLFVLVPIWTHKTARTAMAICEQRIDAIDEPPIPEKELRPLASEDPVEWGGHL